MTAVRPREPSRRAVLAGAGLLVVSACTGSAEVVAPRPSADQRLAARVVAEIRALSALYTAALASHPSLGAAVSAYAAEHRAHLRALTPLLLPTPSPSPSASPSPTPAPTVPPTPATARDALVAAERSAALRRRAQSRRAGPELARLLASIAACEAVHAALLA